MSKNIILLVMILLIMSCETDEIPINIEDVINYTQIDLGENYCIQKYYDIDNDLVLGENLNSDWDIAFSTLTNSIMLNTSKYMRIVAFSPETLLNVDDLIQSANWLYDNPNGEIQQRAFNNGGIELAKEYFLVDKGYDCDNNHLGYSIIRIVDYDLYKYTIQIITVSNDNSFIYSDFQEIEKITAFENIYFSLTTNSLVEIANFEWDLCFTSYTEFNVPAPADASMILPTYKVVGVLQNHHISVAVDSVNGFSDISIANIPEYIFSTHQNSIGYNWKLYNGILGIYSIVSPTYIIQTSSQNYYKLLFIDFYNDNGEKGAPMFQMKKI